MKGNNICIDASVFVSAFLRTEKNSGASLSFIKSLNFSYTFIPNICILEIYSALTRQELEKSSVNKFIKSILKEENIHLIQVDHKLLEESMKFVINYKIKGMDSLYLGCGSLFNCKLVTLDNDQLKANASLEVISPAQYLKSYS